VTPVRNTTVMDLQQRLATGQQPVLLDVREDWEYALCHIDGAMHVPMSQIPARLADIPMDRTLVCVCHHGMRSARVAEYLVRNGFSDVENLDGGVDAWALHIDPDMRRY